MAVSPAEKRRDTYFEPDQGLAFVILVWCGARGLAADNAQLHVLDFEADEEEVDAADNDVLEVVLALGVLKLDVQAVLNADVHLDAVVRVGRDAVAVDPDVLLANHVGHASRDCHPHEVPQLHINAVVRLVLLLYVLEVEIERLRVLQLARRCELLHQRKEFVVVASVEEHLCIKSSGASGNLS